MGAILYSVARTEEGELVFAADAEKSGVFYCGYCQDALILKKSGKTGPRTKRPHFAHKTLTPNCSPESALHFEFKNLLFTAIEDALKGSQELLLSWKCSYCYIKHKGNLLKTARRVSLEHDLGSCRPDIALLDATDRVVAAIEVVVTHAPEDTVREYYRKNKIALVELHLTSENELDDVVGKLGKADRVQLCPDRKRCSRCSYFEQPVLMRLIDSRCYKCNSSMKIPFMVGDDSRGSYIMPHDFTRAEREIAVKNGALIEWQYSRTLNTKYWAVTCKRCRKFVGRNYLFTDYISPAIYDGATITDVHLGTFCAYCYEVEERGRPPENEGFFDVWSRF